MKQLLIKGRRKKHKYTKLFSKSPYRGDLGGLLFLLLLSISTFAQTPQTITFPDIPVKGYGDTSFSLNATASSGLAVTYVSSNTAVATVSGSTVTIKSTSGYSFISAYQAGNASYTAATPVAQLLVVVPKATLIVTADNKTITAGTTTPSLTYTIAGYKKSETSSVVSGSPTLQSPGNNLAAGNYTIVINRGTLAATNYEFMTVDGLLTVNSGTSTPVINAEDSIIKIFPNPASSKLTIQNAENEIISIYDLTGNLVFDAKLAGNSINLDISKLPVASYYIVINKNNTVISRKLLINR